MRLLAKIISRVFDPFIEVPIILMGVAWLAVLNGYRWRFLALLFVVDAITPGIFFLWLWIKRKRKDWEVHDVRMRRPLFLVTLACHALGVIVAYLINRHPLAETLLLLWVVAALFTLISFFWKISVHTGVIMTLVLLINLLIQPMWWLYGLVALVAWARVVDKDHSIAQVLAGAFVPALVLPLLIFIT